MYKHTPLATFRLLSAATIAALLLALVACGKDDPEPGPVPPDPVPPTPPTPVVPDTPRAAALRLLAFPAGDNPEPWSAADTLHLVLTEPDGRTALGDTALYRYAFREGADHPRRFIPASVADSAFLPPDSSEVDLMAYRPASIALQSDRLLLPVDVRELTATGRPLMTTPRTVGISAKQPEASIVLSHQLTRLYVNLNKVSTKSIPSVAMAGETRIVLHGNPAQGTWSLPDETFVAYGDTVSQSFIVQSDGMGGYLYALPGWPGQAGDNKPVLTLTVEIPGRAPLEIPLNDYLPKGVLEAGISIDIQINAPEVPQPDPDPTPDPDPDPTPDPTPDPSPDPEPAPDPAPSPNPDPSPDPEPIPPDLETLHIQVTLSNWEDIIYDAVLLPDKDN